MVLFLGIISWKGASYFNGGGCFSDGGGDLIFKWRGAPWGGIGFDDGRRGVSKKIVGWEGVPPMPSPLWETLLGHYAFHNSVSLTRLQLPVLNSCLLYQASLLYVKFSDCCHNAHELG